MRGLRRKRKKVDLRKIKCASHGPGPGTFMCHHICDARKSDTEGHPYTLLFKDPHAEEESELAGFPVWCEDCEEARDTINGGWEDTVDRFMLVCIQCRDNLIKDVPLLIDIPKVGAKPH